jgi:hypothetical protein
MRGDINRLLAVEPTRIDPGADEGILVIGLGLAGRREEARRALVDMSQKRRIPLFQSWSEYLMNWLDHRAVDMFGGIPTLRGLKIQDDPEAIFLEGWLLCDVDEHERGFGHLQRAVAKGYFVAPTLAASRQFDALRSLPAFQMLLAEAEAGQRLALAAFREAGGERLLGR